MTILRELLQAIRELTAELRAYRDRVDPQPQQGGGGGGPPPVK